MQKWTRHIMREDPIRDKNQGENALSAIFCRSDCFGIKDALVVLLTI